MTNKLETIQKQLLELDCSAYTDEKNKLAYLSWANAYREALKAYPNLDYSIIKDDNGKSYFGDDVVGYMVYTTITIESKTREMWLPVMDFRNKSILKPSTMDINKAIMRCLVKNLAMFGLGTYIYAGEDLPEDNTPVELPTATNELVNKAIAWSIKSDKTKEEILKKLENYKLTKEQETAISTKKEIK